jgi:hypothetical protein
VLHSGFVCTCPLHVQNILKYSSTGLSVAEITKLYIHFIFPFLFLREIILKFPGDISELRNISLFNQIFMRQLFYVFAQPIFSLCYIFSQEATKLRHTSGGGDAKTISSTRGLLVTLNLDKTPRIWANTKIKDVLQNLDLST